jgi:ATP-dependent helicase HrpA
VQLEKLKNDSAAGLTMSSAPRLEEIRWMLEEFRVSAFAQSLKTKIPVSPTRIEKELSAIKGGSKSITY